MAWLVVALVLACRVVAGALTSSFQRQPHLTHEDGVYDPTFAFREMKRITKHLEHSRQTYQRNFRHFESTRRRSVVEARSLRERYAQFEVHHLPPLWIDQPLLSSKRSGSKSSRIELTSFYQNGIDAQYTASVEIGEPAQWFDINFDSGSSDFWIPSEQSSTRHRKFDAKQSSSFKNSSGGNTFSVRYGTGDASGSLGIDQVAVGNLQVEKQVIGLSDTTSSIFEITHMDGLMGFAFSTLSSSHSPTFFENLLASNLVDLHVFSFYLHRAVDFLPTSTNLTVGTVGGGELCLGCIDDTKFSKPLTYHPVTVRGYWQLEVDGIGIDGKVLDSTNSQTAFDTGTSLIYVAPTVASHFYLQFGGKPTDHLGHWALPCSTPNFELSLVIGGISYNIQLVDFVLGYEDSTKEFCVGSIIGQDNNDPQGHPISIVGDSFLKNVYSVFSYDNNAEIGFAPIDVTSSTPSLVASSSNTTSSSPSESSSKTSKSSKHHRTSTTNSIPTSTNPSQVSSTLEQFTLNHLNFVYCFFIWLVTMNVLV